MAILKTLSFLLFSFFLLLGNLFAQSPVELHGALSVNGTKITNQYDQVTNLAGMSLFWSNNGWGGEKYYNAEAVKWLKEDWNISVIRASMGVEDNGGYISNPENIDKVKTIIDAAIEEGLYVIIDWHSHHAEDYEAEAIDFFTQMANLYKDYPNIIYEIYNEPLIVSWSSVIKPYALSVIEAIRAIDPQNIILVGSSTWSQDVDIASNNPIEGYENIAYTLHFYAGTHFQYLRDKAQVALNNGIALWVSEWGTVEASGDGQVNQNSVEEWMDFLCINDISHCNWAVNDKIEGASALKSGANPNGGWSANMLTPSGTLVKNIVKNWCGLVNTEETEDQNSLTPFTLVSNPVNESIQVKTSLWLQQAYWTLCTLNGKIIKKGIFSTSPWDAIDISQHPSGTYLLHLQTEQHRASFKIVKL